MAERFFSWTEQELRKQIVRACRALAARGLVAATDGNVSARLGPDRVLVTPSGMAKGEVSELSVLLCDGDGRKIRGRGEISSEIHVHLAAYRERYDVGAVVHAHPPVTCAFTLAGVEHLLREPIIPEVVAQIGPVPTAPYFTPGSRALAEAAAPLLRKGDVVLLAQHGAVALGPDPWRAYLRMEKLEHAALTLKYARELAGPGAELKRLAPDQIEELLRSYGKGSRTSAAPAAAAAREQTNAAGAPPEDRERLIARVTAEVLRRIGTRA